MNLYLKYLWIRGLINVNVLFTALSGYIEDSIKDSFRALWLFIRCFERDHSRGYFHYVSILFSVLSFQFVLANGTFSLFIYLQLC